MPDEDVRLLLCLEEQTIEALPDYKGPPEQDVLLQYLIDTKHTWPSGTPHMGNLIAVPKKYWDNDVQQKAIKEQIRSSGVLGPGLGQEFDDVKHTFEEDAATCWTRDHNRTLNCGDFRSDKKLLKPNTAAERKELGMPKYEAENAPKRWLCDFCPYMSLLSKSRN